ncbi:Gfo/Idh/MocA family oxidoreductase [Peribacillus muralis]|uniref:Gfo/Idh/MocA family protein n=1 Tax=Peribacillus muralis TaxID=264697 RepID=UPI001F4DADC9|nr:Gfo/Idh/MocA family oxidoreductase [Peribacillus muralis]MCK1992222.1 Gfo/Idh/MocA family oxidoreductase [Peribacillus muralis]MCK2012778.1 Gfo/Idh/MocA family oxidoreductase [Peribacillus muralis]
MQKLKGCIIGAGKQGEVHARTLSEIPYVEVVGICDLNKSRAEELAHKYGIKEVYTDHNEMLAKSDCEFVAIVTPDHLHAQVTIDCANAKKHVLIEKPFATTREDIHAMLEAIERNNVRAMVDLHNRWSPPFSLAKRAIENGDIGEVRSGYIRLNDTKYVATDMLAWSANSSILWFLGSHSLDAITWLVNSRVEKVYSVSREGVLKNLGVDTVDMYQTTLEFENGAIVQMENSWITPNGNTAIIDFKCNVLGAEGMINVNTSSHDLIQITNETKTVTPDILAKPIVEDKMVGFSSNSIRSFIDRLIDGKPFLVSVQEASNTALAIIAILESANTGKAVKVQYEHSLASKG